ncbi:hypothetical protein LCGC14_0887200 [marine sediment metagenome]|uniref:Uncharacterized protein n=1 Tax=marine sediment metagenome TaxID=412755 RepID=A0A0F9P556_9ZZZZ
MSNQLELLPKLSKEELKKQVAVIAKRWPGYENRYDEAKFFAAIDSGKITKEEQINDQFQVARMLML